VQQQGLANSQVSPSIRIPYSLRGVPAVQQHLFRDPQPLVERLGRDFFRSLPECAGVYLMRDVSDAVLYVGKAKNLRNRLRSYRVANPDRMPRRHLRLLSAVARIELRTCADEASALRCEAELLRELRPKFNRSGTWPGPKRLLVWRRDGESIVLKITEREEPSWRRLQPSGGGAHFVRLVLVRLLWFAGRPHDGVVAMPAGWIHGRLDPETEIHIGSSVEVAVETIEQLFAAGPEPFCDWIRGRIPKGVHSFEKTVIEADLEFISDTFALNRRREKNH
jgi:hypothetical protein